MDNDDDDDGNVEDDDGAEDDDGVEDDDVNRCDSNSGGDTVVSRVRHLARSLLQNVLPSVIVFFLYFYIFVFYENILSSETFMTIVHFKIYLKGGNHKIFFFCLLTNVQCSCQRIKFAKLAEWLGLVRIHIDQVSLCFGGLQIKLIKAN